MKLLRSKVLTPWSRVVPMGCFKLIFLILVYKFQIWLSSFLKVAAIDSFVSCSESPNLEIRLTHFSFFVPNIKQRWTLILWVLALWYWDRLLWCYIISKRLEYFKVFGGTYSLCPNRNWSTWRCVQFGVCHVVSSSYQTCKYPSIYARLVSLSPLFL